jgi:hypothetical protein
VPQDARERLRHLVQQRRCVIELEIDRAKMDPTAWDLFDALEAHILRSRRFHLHLRSLLPYDKELSLNEHGVSRSTVGILHHAHGKSSSVFIAGDSLLPSPGLSK